jgi:hypothetical protein
VAVNILACFPYRISGVGKARVNAFASKAATQHEHNESVL